MKNAPVKNVKKENAQKEVPQIGLQFAFSPVGGVVGLPVFDKTSQTEQPKKLTEDERQLFGSLEDMVQELPQKRESQPQVKLEAVKEMPVEKAPQQIKKSAPEEIETLPQGTRFSSHILPGKTTYMSPTSKKKGCWESFLGCLGLDMISTQDSEKYPLVAEIQSKKVQKNFV